MATDGHRLALCEAPLRRRRADAKRQIIVPRKGVLELQRLLEGGDRELELEVGRNHMRVKRDDVTFTTKLIDGRFPDYDAVIPIGADKEVRIDREVLRAALQRAAILSNEKYRGVQLEVSPGQLQDQSRTTRSRKRRRKRSRPRPRSTTWPSASTSTTCWMRSRALRDEHVVLSLRDANSSALVREASSERAGTW